MATRLNPDETTVFNMLLSGLRMVRVQWLSTQSSGRWKILYAPLNQKYVVGAFNESMAHKLLTSARKSSSQAGLIHVAHLVNHTTGRLIFLVDVNRIDPKRSFIPPCSHTDFTVLIASLPQVWQASIDDSSDSASARIRANQARPQSPAQRSQRPLSKRE